MRIDIIHRHKAFALFVAINNSKPRRIVGCSISAIMHLGLEALQAYRKWQQLFFHSLFAIVSHVGVHGLPHSQMYHSSLGCYMSNQCTSQYHYKRQMQSKC